MARANRLQALAIVQCRTRIIAIGGVDHTSQPKRQPCLLDRLADRGDSIARRLGAVLPRLPAVWLVLPDTGRSTLAAVSALYAARLGYCAK